MTSHALAPVLRSTRDGGAHSPAREAVGRWPLGPLFAYRKDPLGTVSRMGAEGTMSFRVLGQTVHLVVRPEHIQHVLVENAKSYGKRTQGYRILRQVVGNGLLTSDGSFWLRQRRIAQPAFHKRRIESFAETMTKVAAETVAAWPDLGTLDVAHEMMGLTLRVVGLTLLSLDVAGETDEVGQALTVGLEEVMFGMNTPWAPPRWVPTRRNRRFNRAMATLNRVVNGVISERRASEAAGRSAPDDLLAMLMGARDPETGEGMSDAQLRDEVMTIFLAGHETTAMALTWTLHLLSIHPEIRAEVVAEIDRVLGGRLPTLGDLKSLELTERVIAESMRLYPPAWVMARSTVEDDDLGGHPVRAGDWTMISPWVTHRQPDLWPDPERFDPARFLPEAVASRPKFAYLPFSGGQRKCIGDSFAKMEASLVLATVLQSFGVEAVEGHVPVPSPKVTLRPKDGMPLRVSRRHGPA